jgi:hypothetical protein
MAPSRTDARPYLEAPALRIFQLRSGPPWPDAHDFCPATYAAMGDISTRGMAFVVNPTERCSLMQLTIHHEDAFELAPQVAEFQAVKQRMKPK